MCWWRGRQVEMFVRVCEAKLGVWCGGDVAMSENGGRVCMWMLGVVCWKERCRECGECSGGRGNVYWMCVERAEWFGGVCAAWRCWKRVWGVLAADSGTGWTRIWTARSGGQMCVLMDVCARDGDGRMRGAVPDAWPGGVWTRAEGVCVREWVSWEVHVTVRRCGLACGAVEVFWGSLCMVGEEVKKTSAERWWFSCGRWRFSCGG